MVRFYFLVALCFSGMIASARAQDQCLASFNVSADQNVTVLNIGSGNEIATTMPCTAAELLRERMFVSGDALDSDVFDDIPALQARLDGIGLKLNQQQAALNSAVSKAQRSAALSALAASGGIVGVLGSTAGCIELKVMSCTKLFLAVTAIFVAVDSSSSTAGDLKAEADAALAQITTLKAAQADLRQRLAGAHSGQYKQRFSAAFAALCSSIRQQCLQ